ncbi:hypothetical protein BR93DRAFT_63761 [Coniochaeta sp. PMI_546]|nr:hypothetical protein BR93DRAFT_63761 [Coniochaeta sp. PMI_546]
MFYVGTGLRSTSQPRMVDVVDRCISSYTRLNYFLLCVLFPQPKVMFYPRGAIFDSSTTKIRALRCGCITCPCAYFLGRMVTRTLAPNHMQRILELPSVCPSSKLRQRMRPFRHESLWVECRHRLFKRIDRYLALTLLSHSDLHCRQKLESS